MERKRKLQRILLTLCAAMQACTYLGEHKECDVRIVFQDLALESKADMPSEDRISDVSLMIFDGNGMLERHFRLENASRNPYIDVSLLKGTEYTICACANFGYDVNVREIRELENLYFHLTYPDEYKEGIPMYASQKAVVTSESDEIRLELTRLMSKISIRMDRSLLAEDVKMDVTGVRIGNCPKKVRVFGQSSAKTEDDCFRVGFSHDDSESSPLNRLRGNGTSDEISLYMLENMQGKFSDKDITSDSNKVFGAMDPRQYTASYIEMELDYRSSGLHSTSPLIYRFYLGQDRNSLDIERNCHYHITVCPENDGLSGDGWRVDKSGITTRSEPSLTPYPSQYIRGDIGDKIHIWCETTPADAPFDVGIEYMEDDKAEGIYDYVVDADGHGATLTLTGPGRGLIYMEAGDPINDAALFIIEVNLP